MSLSERDITRSRLEIDLLKNAGRRMRKDFLRLPAIEICHTFNEVRVQFQVFQKAGGGMPSLM